MFGQADLVYGMAPNVESKRSWEMYSLARRGRLNGLQWITRLMLKQWCRKSKRGSGMGHVLFGSGWLCCFFRFYKLYSLAGMAS